MLWLANHRFIDITLGTANTIPLQLAHEIFNPENVIRLSMDTDAKLDNIEPEIIQQLRDGARECWESKKEAIAEYFSLPI
jgi:hypothetical protein